MNKLKTYEGFVRHLAVNEVFVCGVNESGFHGAGSAGYATFGVPGNVWRQFDYGSKPFGWKGRWTVKGHTGFMEGTVGMSWGLITVTKPGARRSVSKPQLIENIKKLYEFAENRSDFTFYVAQTAKGGYNGYSGTEMAHCFTTAGPIPENLVFQKEFAALISQFLVNN